MLSFAGADRYWNLLTKSGDDSLRWDLCCPLPGADGCWRTVRLSIWNAISLIRKKKMPVAVWLSACFLSGHLRCPHERCRYRAQAGSSLCATNFIVRRGSLCWFSGYDLCSNPAFGPFSLHFSAWEALRFSAPRPITRA